MYQKKQSKKKKKKKEKRKQSPNLPLTYNLEYILMHQIFV